MRTAYRRELKKVEQSKSSGAGLKDRYVPTLWYFEYLTFLNCKETANRGGVDSFVSCDDEASEMLSFNETPTRPNKRRAASLLKKQENLIATAENLLANNKSAAEVYGRSLGLQLQELSKMQRCIAEKLFSDAIFYGKLEQLTMNSTITINDYGTPSPSPTSSSSFLFPPVTSQLNLQSPRPNNAFTIGTNEEEEDTTCKITLYFMIILINE